MKTLIEKVNIELTALENDKYANSLFIDADGFLCIKTQITENAIVCSDEERKQLVICDLYSGKITISKKGLNYQKTEPIKI